jgi:hypothetical protein
MNAGAQAIDASLRGGMAKLLVIVVLLALTPGPAKACNTKVVWQADLTDAELIPDFQPANSGVAVFEFNFHDGIGVPDAKVIVDLPNVKDVTSIDLRAGDSKKPGPILFTLYARKPNKPGKLARHFSKTIIERELKPQSEPKVQTFADVVKEVLEQRAYITVSSSRRATRELRGRITMRKVPIYSPEDSGTGHDPRLHAQAETGKAKARKAPAALLDKN